MDKIAQAYSAKLLEEDDVGYWTSYNVAPTERVPIIIEDEKLDTKIIKLAAFGMPMNYGGKKFPLINLQSEKVANRKDFKSQRCIIDAGGFYEWEKVSPKDKQPYYFSPKSGSFSLAGVWKKDDKGYSFSILTTRANEIVGAIHARMPAILSHNTAGEYLAANSNIKDLSELLEPYPDGLMQSWKVSKDVNSPKQKHAALINSL